MHGDMESTDFDALSSDFGVSAPDAARDHAALNDADASDAAESVDPANEATASSEEESVDDTDAQVYIFPGTNGPIRIYVFTTTGPMDAISLESHGVLAMIDGAEGVGAPDGKGPRHLLREGVEDAALGDMGQVLGYMSNYGVTSLNLAFYLETHTHPDHTDNTDEITKKLRPKVISSPEYSDTRTTDKSCLRDNQWIYGSMTVAMRWAQGAYGASIVQNIKDHSTHITLDDMDVQIIPTDPAENCKKTGVCDTDLIVYTAKMGTFRHSAYLATDLETCGGCEDRIAPIIGHIDILKVGHHSLPNSNSDTFMRALSPSMTAQTGPEWYIPDNPIGSVIHRDSS